MEVLGSNHLFFSVASHELRFFSSASSFSSGVRQATCMVRFSNMFCGRCRCQIPFIYGRVDREQAYTTAPDVSAGYFEREGKERKGEGQEIGSIKNVITQRT
jgi:hypothetical protein